MIYDDYDDDDDGDDDDGDVFRSRCCRLLSEGKVKVLQVQGPENGAGLRLLTIIIIVIIIRRC